MSSKYGFRLDSEDPGRRLPAKCLIGRQETETEVHVLLKFLAYLLFHRDRIQMEVWLDREGLPFVPDLVELDYQLEPVLWVECGECSVQKLDKLAVKVPNAEIWVVKKSLQDAEHLRLAMQKGELRRNRYAIVAFDWEPFQELLGNLKSRNDVRWYRGRIHDGSIQLDFNGLWFDLGFQVLRF